MAFATRVAVLGLCALSLGAGCKRKSDASAVTVGSVTLPAPVASALPLDPKVVSSVVNPKGEAPYAGPFGSIHGVVVATGDAAPVMNEVLAKIPADCDTARQVYGKLFREGPQRGLADVVVGVTGYQGYVPETTQVQAADAAGCAWNSRTYVLTFGQGLDVRSRDSRPYVPDLVGAGLRAQLVAVPQGDAVHLYPEHAGRYGLSDSMRLFMFADVLIVKFPTHAVTGIDGTFVIPRVPVGKVNVSALLPQTMAQTGKDVEVHAGEVVDVKFELPFDRSKWDAARSGKPAVAPSTSSSAH